MSLFDLLSGRLPSEPRCPKCNNILDGYTQLTDGSTSIGSPDNGSLSLCMYCGSILIMNEGLWHIAPADLLVDEQRKHPKEFGWLMLAASEIRSKSA